MAENAGTLEAMEERTRQILEVAIELAEEGGFETVRMRDVAAHAGVALGTFYKRFRSKEDLLVAALGLAMEEMEQRMARRPIEGNTPYERIAEYFTTATRRFCAKPNLARAALRAVASGDHELAEKVMKFHERTTHLILQAVTGGDRPATDEEDRTAIVLQHVWFATLVGWSGGLHDVEEVIERVKSAARLILNVPEPDQSSDSSPETD